jgi:hypothetical protein
MATAVYNPTAQINALGAANKTAANLGLQTARNTSLNTLATAQKAIEPEYLKQRNTVDTNNQVAARNFAEFMAQRGENNAVGNSGSLAQSNITSNAMREGNLGALATGEAQANTENAKQQADVNTLYNSNVASSNATINAATMQSLITAQQNYNAAQIAQENANRAFNAQQAQQALDNQYRQQQANAAAAARQSSGGGGSSSRSSGGGSSRKSSSGGSSGKALTSKQQSSNYQGAIAEAIQAASKAGGLATWVKAQTPQMTAALSPAQAASLKMGGSAYKHILKGV